MCCEQPTIVLPASLSLVRILQSQSLREAVIVEKETFFVYFEGFPYPVTRSEQFKWTYICDSYTCGQCGGVVEGFPTSDFWLLTLCFASYYDLVILLGGQQVKEEPSRVVSNREEPPGAGAGQLS